MFYDVIVIGAGLAGLMAAEAAQGQGAKVLLLARGLGSLPLTTGCIDFLGYFPKTTETPLSAPLTVLPRLQEEYPHHPYALLGQEKIVKAGELFLKISREIGLPYEGSLASNLFILTPLGTFHPTCLFPESMKDGSLSDPDPILLLGFPGLKDFSPFLAAGLLNVLHSAGKVAPFFRAEVVPELALSGKAINGLTLAKAFDRRAFRKDFIKKVKPLIKPGERIGLPAVLGFHSFREALNDLQENLLAKVFEVPLPPPSIPGIRLWQKLQGRFRERGGRMIIGLPPLYPQKEANRLSGLALGSSGKSLVYKASAFVLATGKFFGGGLDSERGKIFETLLGLPLKYPDKRKEWSNPFLLAPEGQPFNRFGVAVDKNLQPIDHDGQVVYANLFAAGGILAQGDSMTEKSGGGVAISTGYWAGRNAAAVK